jgi:SAM-dependent methyltransferase
MLDAHLAEMRELEDHYWWFIGRRRIALALLDDAHLDQARLLDGGCGAGALLAALAERGWAAGVDVSASAIAITRDRGLGRLTQADVEALPFAGGSFDAVMLCDVLEHVPDDQRALDEAARVLRPGGITVLTLPALGFLWGTHDEALGHYRRYHPRRVRQMVAQAGLRLERLSFGLSLLFPVAVVLRFVQRSLHRRRGGPPQTGIIRVPRWVNRLLVVLMDLENALIRRANLPIGVSLVAVARRPESPPSPP